MPGKDVMRHMYCVKHCLWLALLLAQRGTYIHYQIAWGVVPSTRPLLLAVWVCSLQFNKVAATKTQQKNDRFFKTSNIIHQRCVYVRIATHSNKVLNKVRRNV